MVIRQTGTEAYKQIALLFYHKAKPQNHDVVFMQWASKRVNKSLGQTGCLT